MIPNRNDFKEQRWPYDAGNVLLIQRDANGKLGLFLMPVCIDLQIFCLKSSTVYGSRQRSKSNARLTKGGYIKQPFGPIIGYYIEGNILESRNPTDYVYLKIA